jgi:hypothetical protein
MPAAAWLRFLYQAEGLAWIAVNVTVLFMIYPAYRRTKSLALLLLGWAYLIGAFDSICDDTSGLTRLFGTDYNIYHTFRRFSDIVICILSGTGLILLVRSFLRLKGQVEPEASENMDTTKAPGFFRRVFARMME